MMDAPGQHFLQASTADSVAGAVWLVDEGGLSAELSQAVWAGYRRPRGNLVAQSLAAHGGDPLAGDGSVELRFILRAKEKVLGNS